MIPNLPGEQVSIHARCGRDSLGCNTCSRPARKSATTLAAGARHIARFFLDKRLICTMLFPVMLALGNNEHTSAINQQMLEHHAAKAAITLLGKQHRIRGRLPIFFRHRHLAGLCSVANIPCGSSKASLPPTKSALRLLSLL
jgi:hypothetical protein